MPGYTMDPDARRALLQPLTRAVPCRCHFPVAQVVVEVTDVFI